MRAGIIAAAVLTLVSSLRPRITGIRRHSSSSHSCSSDCSRRRRHGPRRIRSSHRQRVPRTGDAVERHSPRSAGKKLMRIEHAALVAVTQPLFAHTKTTEIAASAAVVVEVDLILPPDTAPERLTHRIAYALKAGSVLAPMFDNLQVDAPDVTITREPAMVLKPPVKGDGWLVSSGCCKPNLHRDLRVAIDGLRIGTSRALLSTGPRPRTAKSSRATAAKTNSTTPSSRTCSRSPTAPWFRSRTANRRQPRTSQWFRKRRKTTAAIM